MSFYADMAAVALSLLQSFGVPVVLYRETGKSVDPVSGEVVAGTSTSVTTTGVLSRYEESQIDGARIMAGDRKLVLSAEHEPLPSDLPTIAGERWPIVSIQSVKPDGATPVVYFVQVRR